MNYHLYQQRPNLLHFTEACKSASIEHVLMDHASQASLVPVEHLSRIPPSSIQPEEESDADLELNASASMRNDERVLMNRESNPDCEDERRVFISTANVHCSKELLRTLFPDECGDAIQNIEMMNDKSALVTFHQKSG